ncbi:hypothetical protein BGY98DRAFT_915266 [Russula aff. rugulosa BPL654]|nr:hypothetical protein BGY98DRAFT_915266 [Russula aff. rugulosa BPL654]
MLIEHGADLPPPQPLELHPFRSSVVTPGPAATLPPLPEPSETNGKGKGKQVTLAQEELVQNQSKAQIEAEINELGELKQNLALKVGELKSAPNDERDGGLSAPELAQRALDRELNSDPEARQRQDLLMNDLTSMVVKRKAPVAVPEASGAAEKRKAEDEEAQTSQNKKARLEESPAP